MYTYPTNPGPSWNIPRISAPQCLGLLPQYEVEWWYYAGIAEAAGERFSVQLSIDRFGTGAFGVSIALIGIGTQSNDAYSLTTGYGLGVWQDVPDPIGLSVARVTDDRYDLSFAEALTATRIHAVYTGGAPVGTIGSTYRMDASGTDRDGNAVATTLWLKDQRGLVLEGQSGYVGPGMAGGGGEVGEGAATYEFAQPRLAITGGSITLGSTAHELTGGALWLDRQVLTNPHDGAKRAPVDPARLHLAVSQNQLYCGDWMAITLDAGLTMVLATFWQPASPEHPAQWITGTKVGITPRGAFGAVYFPPGETLDGAIGLLGARLDAQSWDFDVNLLGYENPPESPHWTSPQSNTTYATAWVLDFGASAVAVGVPPRLFLRALVRGTENLMATNYYWEGAADVYADSAFEQRVGSAFVEQMGFN